jgi:hypothetical protein
MGFLDNSGDIILDVVLTDLGRQLLAKGDGSFNVAKFALADDEIDYSLYDKTNASGSSYYDLSILQTPVLEAFTDNAASMKNKLLTLENQNLLFLPVSKLNQAIATTKMHPSGAFFVAVDRNTEDNSNNSLTSSIAFDSEGLLRTGFILGESLGAGRESSNYIRVDQGLDNTQVSPKQNLDPDLVETEYMIQIDNRLGSLVSRDGATKIVPDSIDDDNIAYYSLSQGTDQQFVFVNTSTDNSVNEAIAGPRGTILEFSIAASLELNTSTYLFTQLGSTVLLPNQTSGNNTTTKFIDTIVKVTGMTTGYSIDVPVRFVKI